MSDWAVFRAVLVRDLRLEWRTRDALQGMFFYALLVIVIFGFTLGAAGTPAIHIEGGLLWVAFLFAGLIALDRAFLRELGDGCLAGLRLSPAAPAAIMGGKFASSLAVMLALEAVLLPVFAILFNVPHGARWGGVALTVGLGTWALAANGTYFAAMSVHARQRGLLLPLLLLPISIPALLAAVNATQYFLAGEGMANYWLRMLAGYDVVYTALGLALAELVLASD